MTNFIEILESQPLEQYIRPFPNTYALVNYVANRFKHRIALEFVASAKEQKVTQQYSYDELLTHINQIGNMLLQQDIQKTDIVTILLPNLPQSFLTLAASEAVAIANPISPALSTTTLKHLLQKTCSKFIFTTPELWNKLVDAQIDQQFEHVFFIYETKDQEYSEYDPINLANVHQINSTDICSIFHTSGTTGVPKLAQFTHFNRVYNAWSVAEMLGYTEQDIIHAALPYFHVGAPTLAGNAAFLKGAKVILFNSLGWMDPEVTEYFWQNLEHFNITSMSALHFTYAALIQTYQNENTDSLRHALSGTALPETNYHTFKKLTGVKIQEIYGLTECGCIAATNLLNDDSKQGSMGLAYPFTKIKAIITSATGAYVRDCEIGEIGTICIQGPGVTIGYLSEQNNHSKFPQAGWLNTEDIGYQDIEGYFHFSSRVFDLINSDTGHDKLPIDTERYLQAHFNVKQAAVITQPDVLQSQIIIAYVSLYNDSSTAREELTEYLFSKGDKLLMPVELFFLSRLPTNGMGKILKNTLQQYAIQSLYTKHINSTFNDNEIIDVKITFDNPDDPDATAQISLSVSPEVNSLKREKLNGLIAQYKKPHYIHWQ